MAYACTVTKRHLLLLLGGCALSACARDRFRVEPVILGGSAVKPDMTIMDALAASENHVKLTEALRTTGLDVPLSGTGPFTLLAPTDRAFDAIRPKDQGARVKADPTILERTLRGHVIPAKVSRMDIDSGIDSNGGETKVLGLNGLPVSFDRDGDTIRAYDTRGRRATLGPMDAIAANGLIHVIDDVLLLSDDEEEPAEPASP